MKERRLEIFILYTILCEILATIMMVAVPSDIENQFLLGFSFKRWILILIVVLCLGISIFLLYISWSKKWFYPALSHFFQFPPRGMSFSLLLAVIVLAGILAISVFKDYAVRLQPIILMLFLFTTGYSLYDIILLNHRPWLTFVELLKKTREQLSLFNQKSQEKILRNITNQSTNKKVFHWNSNTILIIIILVYVLIYCTGVVITQRNFIFDDSFITYRYSKNLAQGYGITWNPNEPPVEGYTNFLLVVVLAPFIRLGISPLLVTRILSLICAGVMFYCLFMISRDQSLSHTSLVIFIPALFLLTSKTIPLSMVGLETVLFSTALFVAFLFWGEFSKTKSMHFAYYFGFCTFIAFLLRPEAFLLLVSIGCITLIQCVRKDLPWTIALKLLKAVIISFIFPTLIYLIWKYVHFGTLIPNSFLIKMSDVGLISHDGLASVRSFIKTNIIIILTSLVSFVVEKNYRWQRAVAALLCIIYSLFYLRVDTLMDEYGRFMYPIIIFLVFLSIPTFNFLFELIYSRRWYGFVKTSLVIILLFALTWKPFRETNVNLKDIVHGRDPYSGSKLLMQKEYRVALALSQYPSISRIRIAFGDAGVIPYYSGSLSLDTVGLNDRFIAQERDLRKLTEYFFNQKPDLILQPGWNDFTWLTSGHGPLGNYLLWSTDAQWDKYAYIGTIRTGYYDIYMFLRRDLSDFTQFKEFLKDFVADGTYTDLPIAIGNYHPMQNQEPVWIPLPGG
jgi:hypothetical protein